MAALFHAFRDIPFAVRWLTIILVSLIVLLQYPLWLGKGGWLKVWDYNRLLAAQREENRRLEARNAGLDAEVRDLKQGYEAIEERARFDLGMVKEGEIFVQLPDVPAKAAAAAPGTPLSPPPGRPASQSTTQSASQPARSAR